MSMFSPDNLNLARRFMAGPRSQPGGQYAGRYPDMRGFSQGPMGRGLLMRVMQQMRNRRTGSMAATRRGRPSGPVTPQVKRETTEYFDGMSSPRQGA